MRLAIVGSVDIAHARKEVMFLCESLLWSNLTVGHEDDELVSGGADGVDTEAEDAADRFGFRKRIFLPRNLHWETGFRPRNIEIAEYCERLVAIRSRTSTSYGSGWTADYAEELGREVFRYYV